MDTGIVIRKMINSSELGREQSSQSLKRLLVRAMDMYVDLNIDQLNTKQET